jgi:transcription termination/antitermination protein NusA
MRELVIQHKAVLSQIPNLGDMYAEILVNEGYKDPSDVARLDQKGLMKLLRLTPEEADVVLAGAADLASKLHSRDDLDADSDLDFDMPALDDAVQEEANLEMLVSKSRVVSAIDPDKLDVKMIPAERLQYWMKLRGVGETTAAALHVAGFESYESVVRHTADDIALKTGLPTKFSGKIHAEVTKIAGV